MLKASKMVQQANVLATKPENQTLIPGKWKETGLEKEGRAAFLLLSTECWSRPKSSYANFTFLEKYYLNIFLSGPMIFKH